MYICEICDRQFPRKDNLIRHLREQHDIDILPATAPASRAFSTTCPSCAFVIPYTIGKTRGAQTVCPRCLCWFELGSGALISPPPAKSVVQIAKERGTYERREA